jgi:uncharacterized NAD-dependent epimerase/dehydratase family protein
METYLAAARLTNPQVRFAGVSLNTSRVGEPEAARAQAETSARLSLPCCDPIRNGVGPIVDNVLSMAR